MTNTKARVLDLGFGAFGARVQGVQDQFRIQVGGTKARPNQ